MSLNAHIRAAHTTDSSPPDPLVLDGQGIPSSTSVHVTQTALADSKTPLGAAILLACHQAFVQEFNALTAEERAASGIDIQDLSTPESLLESLSIYPSNAVFANTHLYLIQLLCYVRNNPLGTSGPTEHATQEVGILAFSTGVFAGVVIACAKTVPTFIQHAVEVFRSAFWLGIRIQLYATRDAAPRGSASLPWSLVIFGSARSEIQHAVDLYNAERSNMGDPKVHVTAVTHATCISVSGHPDALAAFKADYLPSTVSSTRYAAVYALYHSPELAGVKEDVMRDLSRRDIHFPAHADLQRGLRSTISGKLISTESDERYTLAEEVMDMTILHPVNFDHILDAIHEEVAPSTSAVVRLINIGPGHMLWRSVSRALSNIRLDLVDWTSAGIKGLNAAIPSSVQAISHHKPPSQPIAIVGMAARFPGAEDANGLWKVLEKGLNTVSEVPSSRFNVSEYISGAHGAKRTLKTRFGNFLDDPATFDNAFFHISPREARNMDPQQRILLEVSHHALENAGYVPGATPSFHLETFATYVGVATNDYVQNLRNDVDVYYSTGTLQAFLSGKISYAFGFSGPSVVVDTACSSSMVAIHQACRSLTDGDCNAAIAGGVNIITSPDMYIGLDRGHFLSPTGQCKPWDASADGYCRSEGCGMFVLKRLSDAIAENDNILAVIRGIEVNQSAQAESITHPHVPTQIKLFKRLLSSAGVEPDQISVVEAHGTGTKAGDPTEIESIRTVFAKNRSPENPLHLTSVKANIGHTEAASGAASLAKLILMMRHRTIPAVISLKQLNPNIRALDSDGTRIDTTTVPWNNAHTGAGGGRLALLNNFGAAGSNAALILQEGPVRTPTSAPRDGSGPSFVVGVSCETEAGLEKQRAAYISHIEEHVHNQVELGDFAYSATARRRTFRYRLAGHGATKEEVCASLRTAKIVEIHENLGKVVFVFTGQGGQYLGMGAGLYRGHAAFRETVDHCHEMLVSWGLPGVLDIINAREECEVENVQAFQSSIFVLECALASMWISWGIKPDAIAGHSLGEYAALVTAGVLSLDDGLKLVAKRAQLMVNKCMLNDTGMLAVKLNPALLEELISKDPIYNKLSVACYNSYCDGVVAGNRSQLEQFQKEMTRSGHKCALVDVPFGYHTDSMDPILEDITLLASTVTLSSPSLPIVSNVLGRVVRPGDPSVFVPEYFARHCVQPVRFEQGIQDLVSQEDFNLVSAWIEIGPHPTTLPMLRSIPGTSHQAVYLPTLRKKTQDWFTLCGSLSAVYCMPIAVNWRDIFGALVPDVRLVDLPAYPFEKTRYWVKFCEPKQSSIPSPLPAPGPTRFSLVETCVCWPEAGSSEPAVFDTSIAKLSHLVEGHKVSGHALCPASVYIEVVSAAAQLTMEHLGRMQPDTVVALSQISFQNPLIYNADLARTIRIEISVSAGSEKYTGKFTVSSYVSNPSELQAHCSGVFGFPIKADICSRISQSSTMIQRRRDAMLKGTYCKPPETFYTRTAYDVIFSRIVVYSEAYQTMKSVTIDPNGVDAYATMQLRADVAPGVYIAHPIFMDTLLHAAGFVINCNARSGEAFICNQVDKVKVLPELVKPGTEYGIYCSIGFFSETLAVADAYAFETRDSSLLMVAHMKRMHFRKLRLSAFERVLSAAATRVTSTPPPTKNAIQTSRPTPRRLASYATDTTMVAVSMDQVKDLIANVLGTPAGGLSEDDDLERLGMDSLMFIETWNSLRSAFNVTISLQVLSTCRTIRSIRSSLDSALSGADDSGIMKSGTESTLHSSDGAESDGNQSVDLMRIKEIVASVLDIPTRDLSDNQNLERLGMDSLMSIEAHHALRVGLDLTLTDDMFATCKTVRELHSLICVSPPKQIAPRSRSVTHASAAREIASRVVALGADVNPVKLQNGNSSATPLFLIHDGSGTVHQYGRLSSLDRPVWGIHNPKFATGDKWEGGVLEMAAHYVGLFRSVLSGSDRCFIGGWSFGGVVAFEVARQLIASGIDVTGMVLIDSPPPQTKAPLSASVIAAAFAGGSSSRATELARTQIQLATEALVEYDPDLSPARDILPMKTVMLRCRESFPIGRRRSRSQSDIFLSERGDPTTIVAEWEKLLGYRICVFDIPGNHFEPFDYRHVAEVSQLLIEAISTMSVD